ncbi:hypothetical protein C1752_01970 [Acaryochloris thomasi RCC1774]|uniref:Chromosome segregation ATPase n=1 Tax=Acaryochloris thomasi RCC1774 TaxID=1764569 RepID=A0A2W1JIX0_9CYAN|nr:hypothetical protein [Acaryochloris thomasi]PZD73420.1 hypothetical protein C1752_01970 [Acaryochloris thomasi RCC1774]
MTNKGTTEGGSSAVDKTLENEAAELSQGSLHVAKVQKAFVGVSQWRAWPWVIVLVVSWLTGVTAFRWLSSLPPSPNCKIAPTLSDADRLDCADQVARKGDVESLSSALKLVSSWDKDNPLYVRASDLADEWSKAMLVMARREMDSGDLKKAVELANQVPETVESHTEAQALISKWQENRGKGQKILEEAREQIKEQNWTQATLRVRSLVELGDQYWQDRADQLLKEMAIEKEAFKILYEAQSVTRSVGKYSRRRPEKIAEAIQLVSTIDSKRLAREKGQETVEEWSEDLLEIAEYRAERGEFDQAVAAAQKIPPNTEAAKDATALIQLGRAEVVAEEEDVLSYLQAWALAQQVGDKEMAQTEGQERVDEWEQQIRNFGQLQLAKLFANVDSIFTYQAAINHAALVKAEQPQRIEAQTLIAQWTKQIETYNDRQHITRSRRFATQKTVPGYQAAISAARKVEIGQPLRLDAQSLVAEWENEIEKIEDRPILEEARAKAKSGDLNDAVQIARKIESDRALYSDARSDIADWVAQIQTAEDRPILNEAEALASRGSLSRAISKASQIRYGRALYYDAQRRISRWAGQRDAILAERRRREAARQQRQRPQIQQRQRPTAPSRSRPEAVESAPESVPDVSESE